MPKLLVAIASATLLLVSSGIGKANAATITNAGTLAPLTKSYTPAEKAGYWRRQYRRAYRRGYYGYGYGYPSYGYAYPAYPYYGYAYPAYPYYGYAYRPYGYGWGWGY